MEINVIFFGDFSYPKGMAGTNRVQHAIDALTENKIRCSVIITRQATKFNQPAGIYRGTPFHTLMPDLIGWRLAIFLPLLVIKSFSAIRRLFQPEKKNILYVYGPPFLSNIFTVVYARSLGYLIVFDIVEDDDFAKNIAKDWCHIVKTYFNRYLTSGIAKIANGLIVISSALEDKFCKLTQGRLPLHLRYISINPKKFLQNTIISNIQPTMFYSGSFGVKDGISELLDAFDNLAAKHADLKLVMTGKGTDQRMKEVMGRVQASPAKDRIDYKGYVDDEKYYEILANSDVPCMTRVDSGYANAGFPFKLGEYLAAGKPVVASKVSDVKKFFKDRHDAMLVNPGDSKDIASAVEYLLSNPEKAIEIGKRGREKALLLFDYRIQGKELLKFLRTL